MCVISLRRWLLQEEAGMRIVVRDLVSCNCADWERHQLADQTEKELESRRRNASSVEVIGVTQRGPLLAVRTCTRDKQERRFHEVLMPRVPQGRLNGWRCKHILVAEEAVNVGSGVSAN
jgi:hypothetical protein